MITKITKMVLTVVLASTMVMPCSAKSMMTVSYNGQQRQLSKQALRVGDRVLVPLRAIFESLNATVDYNDSTKTITGSQDDNLIILKIGEKVASVNGKKITLDVPAQIIMDFTVVPVRFISESLGASVVWADKTVLIEGVKTEVK